ncbi:MAG: lysine transporter LysE [Hyphomicrobiales bacterium]|nr:MAG: lysine transporter LysE [Hyphomicrobiales bacterium]
MNVLVILVFLFPLAFSPGPGNMFFAANSARFGMRATLPANFGYHAATWIVTMLIGAGLGGIIIQFPTAGLWMKYLGAAYVFWLAIKLARSSAPGEGKVAIAGFWDGFMLLLLNPKGYVIMMLLCTQFVVATQASTSQLIWVATIFTLNNFVAFCVYSFAGDRIGQCFRDERYAKWLNGGFGLILAMVAIWMAVSL